jgi:hypothetical protein
VIWCNGSLIHISTRLSIISLIDSVFPWRMGAIQTLLHSVQNLQPIKNWSHRMREDAMLWGSVIVVT